MLPILLGAAILALAATILVRRGIAFFRTKGHSACEHCPYAKSCTGGCRKDRPKRRKIPR